MDPKIEKYILVQADGRQALLRAIHTIIIDEDKTVVAVVEPMMGKEMIIYKGKGLMKYGLAGGKNYMSLHVMPIYGSEKLYAKYKAVLNRASFQKGCINFDNAEQMPVAIVRQLMADCAKVDLLKIKEDFLKNRKVKGKPKD